MNAAVAVAVAVETWDHGSWTIGIGIGNVHGSGTPDIYIHVAFP
jgi:hypothetical protein